MTTTMNEYVDTETRILNEFQKLRSIPAVIERLNDISPSLIKDTLDSQKHLSLPRFPKRSGFTKEAMVEALKEAAATGATSVDRYGEFRDTRPELPSAQTVILRFGSWSEAQRAAGIAPRKRVSAASLKSYSDEMINAAIRSFVYHASSMKIKPTQKAYDSWSRAQREIGNDTPLLPTVRARTNDDTWADIVRRAHLSL
jgi:hypothetical protein